MRSPGRVEGRARRHGGMQLRRQVRPHPYRPRTSDVPDFSSWPIATTQPRSHFFHASPRTPEHALARDQARALMRVLQPSTGSPTPESIRALASLFGGTGGFVSHDTILAVVRLPRSVLTTRLYSLFPRHTLEAFLTTLANVHARVRLRTPRSAVGTAKTLTEKEARLEFAFEVYDLDGDGVVTEAELLEIVYETMKGNGAKIASTLRAASAACALPERELRENGPSFRFPEFRTLAERVPSLLFPAQTLYELMRENAKHAETALRALRARAQSEPRSSASLSAFPERPPTMTNGSRNNNTTRRTVPVVPNGHVDTRMSEMSEMSESEARARCASLSAEALSSFLENIGMDLGLDLMDADELADLAAAGALSTGRALPALTPETERGEREDDASRASRENSPSSSPSSSRRRASSFRVRRGRASLADAFAAGPGPPPSPSTRAADAFRAARMGRADALEAMIRAGEVHQDATDASSEHAFSLLMAAAMSGAKGACRRLLSLGADASATDARGRTALDLALEYGHEAVADLLARKGVPFGDPLPKSEAERADDESRRDASRSAEPSAPPARMTLESARESVSSVSPLDGLDRRGIVVSAPPLVSASETQVVLRRGMEGSGDGKNPARNEGPLLSPE